MLLGAMLAGGGKEGATGGTTIVGGFEGGGIECCGTGGERGEWTAILYKQQMAEPCSTQN